MNLTLRRSGGEQSVMVYEFFFSVIITDYSWISIS
jgi:hypothetical protein